VLQARPEEVIGPQTCSKNGTERIAACGHVIEPPAPSSDRCEPATALDSNSILNELADVNVSSGHPRKAIHAEVSKRVASARDL